MLSISEVFFMSWKISKIIECALNFIVFVFVMTGWMMMLFGDSSLTLSSEGLGSLKYFTVLSNLFVGITSLLSAIYGLISLFKGEEMMPLWAMIVHFSAVAGVTITFLVVVCFLSPVAEINGQGYFVMFKGANLFLHLFSPLFAIINYIFFANNPKITAKSVSFCVIPVLLYGIFYVLNYYLRWVNSEIEGSPNYDWYGFMGDGSALHVVVLMLTFIVGSFLLGLGLWALNKVTSKLHKQS